MEIWQEIQEVRKEKDECIKTLVKNGVALAKAKRNYQVALRQEILKLRFEKVPATLTLDLAKGEDKVAELREKKDIALTVWEANKDATYSKNNDLSILKTIYEKEYENTR